MRNNTKIKNIPLRTIISVSKEVFEGKLNSITIFMNDGNEWFISTEELEDKDYLDNFFEILISKKAENTYKLKELDISTIDEKEL